MRPVMHGTLVGLVTATLVLSVRTASAQSYRSDAHHFTIDLPEGWKAMPPDAVRGVNTLAGLMSPGVKYDAVLTQRGDAASPGAFVPIEVLMGRKAGWSYAELESALTYEFGSGYQPSKVMPFFLRDVKVLSAKLERNRNRVVLRYRYTIPLAGQTESISFGMFGADRLVYLHCHAPGADLSLALPAFEVIADSFRFDPGHEYTQTRPVIAPRMGADLLIAAVFCGSVFSIYFLARYVRRRRSQPADTMSAGGP